MMDALLGEFVDGNEILARTCSSCKQPIHVWQLYYGSNGGSAVHSPDCEVQPEPEQQDTTWRGVNR